MGNLRLDLERRNAEIRTSREAASALAARLGLTSSAVNRIRSAPPRELTRRERFQLEVVEGGWTAACMDPDEWSGWLRANPMNVADGSFADRPCRDCPMSFATEMRALGRCNGMPSGSEGEPAAEKEGLVTVAEAAVVAATESPVDKVETRSQPGEGRPGAHWVRKRAAKADRVFAALRDTPGYEQAADRLGMSRSALKGLVRQYRVDGTLPEDLEELIKTRAPTSGRPKPAAAAKAAHIVSTDSTIEGPEAGAPATAAATVEPPARDRATEVATPPGPTAVIEDAYSAPDLTAIDGEDRCSWGHVFTPGMVAVCDRAIGHDGNHRGRMLRIGFISSSFAVFGHFAATAS